MLSHSGPGNQSRTCLLLSDKEGMFGEFFSITHSSLSPQFNQKARKFMQFTQPTEDAWVMAEKQANVQLHICLVTCQPPRLCALDFPKQRLCLCITSTGLVALLGI